MSENLQWYTKALYGMDHVVRLVPDDRWDAPSPCVGWTARSVLGHVIGIQSFYVAIIAGREPTANPMVDPHIIAGEDPRAAWSATRDRVLESLDAPGVLRSTVQNWNGPAVVDDIIGFNVFDTTVHTWDLARATGVDERLDPGLLARADAIVRPRADTMRNPMVFGDAVAIAAGADAQTRLLALTGRVA